MNTNLARLVLQWVALVEYTDPHASLDAEIEYIEEQIMDEMMKLTSAWAKDMDTMTAEIEANAPDPKPCAECGEPMYLPDETEVHYDCERDEYGILDSECECHQSLADNADVYVCLRHRQAMKQKGLLR